MHYSRGVPRGRLRGLFGPETIKIPICCECVREKTETGKVISGLCSFAPVVACMYACVDRGMAGSDIDQYCLDGRKVREDCDDVRQKRDDDKLERTLCWILILCQLRRIGDTHIRYPHPTQSR